jgi:hypothetical protein
VEVAQELLVKLETELRQISSLVTEETEKILGLLGQLQPQQESAVTTQVVEVVDRTHHRIDLKA